FLAEDVVGTLLLRGVWRVITRGSGACTRGKASGGLGGLARSAPRGRQPTVWQRLPPCCRAEVRRRGCSSRRSRRRWPGGRRRGTGTPLGSHGCPMSEDREGWANPTTEAGVCAQ